MVRAKPAPDPSLLALTPKHAANQGCGFRLSLRDPAALTGSAFGQLSRGDPGMSMAITPLFRSPSTTMPWLEENCCFSWLLSFERWSPKSSCLQASSILGCRSACILCPFDFPEAGSPCSARDGGLLGSLSFRLTPLSPCILSSFKNKLCL